MDVIELYDTYPFERWCLQEDIDSLVAFMLDKSVELPLGVISLDVQYVTVDGEEHFAEGATLRITELKDKPRGTNRSRKAKKLRDDQVCCRVITYDRFYTVLLYFVETWLKELPILKGGRLDVGELSALMCKRFIRCLVGY